MAAAMARTLALSEVTEFLSRLPELDLDVPDAERIDLIASLEAVKAAAAAAQARVSVAFAVSQEAEQEAAGVRAADRGKGIGAQVALARRESPHRGARHLGLAKALVRELPHTMAHLSSGRVSEWRATIVARETACLSVADRKAVDAALSRDLPALSDRQVETRAKSLAAGLDPESVVARAAKAVDDRRVSLRPAPDTMTWLGALLPVAQGVAAYAALKHAAAAARASGAAEGRTEGQVMADTLITRLTGQTRAEAVPLEVLVVASDQAMAGVLDQSGTGGEPGPAGEPGTPGRPVAGTPGADEPGTIGGQVVPAQSVRDIVRRALEAGARVTTRRVRTTPDGCDVQAVDARATRLDADDARAGDLVRLPAQALVASSSRFVRGGLRRTMLVRDQHCRTPYCDAPIRHADHVVPTSRGGRSTETNSQGQCEACNYTKEALGWSAEVIRGSPHTVRITTPTGRTYTSTAPPVLPSRQRAADGVAEGRAHVEGFEGLQSA